MYYDLIIVTQSKGDLISMTQECIDSARECDLNVILVETGNPYRYDVDKIVQYNGPFNYNRALNLGMKYAKGDVHILANNDIIFHKGWSKIGDQMRVNGYHSACALSSDPRQKDFQRGDFVYEGYEVGKHLTGWCIFLDRYCYEKIGKLDDSVSFWYSDNIYALQLRSEGIRHGLFCNIQVDHLTSRTLVTQNKAQQRFYQKGEYNKFRERDIYYAKREKANGLHS